MGIACHINTRIPQNSTPNFFHLPPIQLTHVWVLIWSALSGSYGKLLGPGAAASLSSHRYSPYPLPGAGAGQHTGHTQGAAGGVQYTVASPLMSQLSAPGQATVLPTSTPSQHQHQHLEAVAAAGAVPSHVNQTQGDHTSMIITLHPSDG